MSAVLTRLRGLTTTARASAVVEDVTGWACPVEERHEKAMAAITARGMAAL
jgi:hypothetical protein